MLHKGSSSLQQSIGRRQE
jgi:hypothetical protein